MKAEKPAQGIMLNGQYKDSTYFSVFCTCHNPDDTVHVCVERDEYGEIIVQLETIAKTHWWLQLANWQTHKIDNPILYYLVNSAQELINGIYQRLKITREVWARGYVEHQTTCILDRQRALNFAQALQQAVDDLENDDDQ